MSNLATKTCKPCAPGTPPLTRAQAGGLLSRVPGWSLNDAATELSRTFKFKNYQYINGKLI